MVNSYIRARSPKGNVGVTDVVDAGELSAYSAGVLSGFTAKSAASWTLQIGGVSGTQDVAIAKNPGGESELFSGTAGQSIAFVIGGAPGTPGQSRTDALVIYKDPFTTSVVNNGVDVTDYQVVAGTAATTGTQVPPNDAAIRAAIPSGSLKFYTVIGYVTIAYGASSVSLGNHVVNQSILNANTIGLDSITAAKLLKGQVAKRQGGSATGWGTVGTTNYDVSSTDLLIQVGTATGVSTTNTVTFPTAYTYVPFVMVTPLGSGGVPAPFYLIPYPTTVSFGVYNNGGLFAFNWMAIGV